MARYVEFWHLDRDPVTKVGTARPAVGSESVLFIDGRWGMRRIHQLAQKVGRQRGFHGYMLRSGPMNRQEDRDFWDSVREINYYDGEGVLLPDAKR